MHYSHRKANSCIFTVKENRNGWMAYQKQITELFKAGCYDPMGGGVYKAMI